MNRTEVLATIQEAWSCNRRADYTRMLSTARRATRGARLLGDMEAELRALMAEAAALKMLGDAPGALQNYGAVLAMARDPHRRDQVERLDVVEQIARAYMDWVVCARFIPGVKVASLLDVLEEGEAFLKSVDRTHWRAGLLSQRAEVLDDLGRTSEALRHAEAAVNLAARDPEIPGYTLATYRWSYGDILRRAGRAEDAALQYHAVLADPQASPYDRKVAHQGLCRCALAQDDTTTARREGRAAVTAAERMGDAALCGALSAYVEACRAAHRFQAARLAADRLLQCARRSASQNRLYYALRDAAEVAMDEGEVVRARKLLTEASPIADDLDQSCQNQAWSRDIHRRYARLEELEAARGMGRTP